MIFFSQIQKEKHKKPFCFLKTESLKNKVHGMSSPKSNINRPTGPNSHLSTSANTQHLARILISLSLSLSVQPNNTLYSKCILNDTPKNG